jgi:NAD(P)-dependent dehydrogenase (short-subunit alcohol dehydrogenase family)
VGAARDLTKAKAATEQLRKGAAANGGSFGLVELDLASLKSVRACADKLLAKGEPFDVVVANAGVMATPFGTRRTALKHSLAPITWATLFSLTALRPCSAQAGE